MNIAHLLTEAAKDRPDHTAISFEDRDFAYEELDRLTDRAANALTGLEAGRGEVVAIFLESGPELLVGYLGALKAGAVPNVVNAALQPEEVRHVVADSGARVLITDPDRSAALEPVREELGVRHVLSTGGGEPTAGAHSFDAVLAAASDRFATLDLDPGDLASLLYTSGTTGHPKGVMLTHCNILDNARQFARVHYAADDRLLILAPLFHCWGLINGLLGIFAVGGTAILIRRFRTEPTLDLIESAQPTILMAVPTMINFLTKSPTIDRRDRSSLRVVLSAAAPMPLGLIEVLRRDWGVGYAEAYGLTETSPVITTTNAREMRPGSCGRAMGDTRLKVADPLGNPLPVGSVGELWAQGTAVSAGYYRRPDETARVCMPDGWLRTGDIGRIDEEGYVYVVDRAKDMINLGGEKVFPHDVEEVLHRHPAVADAVVVGVPDPDFGEAVKAYIVLEPGFAWSADEVIAYLKPILARFKLPRQVEFITAIPRSASGKVLRRQLRTRGGA
jgi:long-chain acyl-CoA synthetase